MTPEEKANELIELFLNGLNCSKEQAISASLSSVDEKVDALGKNCTEAVVSFWDEVKKKLNQY